MHFYVYLKGETILISKMDYVAGGFCSVSNQQLHGSSVLIGGLFSKNDSVQKSEFHFCRRIKCE